MRTVPMVDAFSWGRRVPFPSRYVAFASEWIPARSGDPVGTWTVHWRLAWAPGPRLGIDRATVRVAGVYVPVGENMKVTFGSTVPSSSTVTAGAPPRLLPPPSSTMVSPGAPRHA